MAGNSSSRHVFETLREVCASREPVGVAEISRRLDLSLSTAQRALLTLTQAGYLKRHPYVPKYRIGFTAERLVNALLERFRIRGASVLCLRRLAAASRRTASLYVRLGWYSVRLLGIEAGNNPAPHARRLGEAAFLTEDAASLAILAFLPDDEGARFAHFAASIHVASAPERRLGEIRAKGYAYRGGTGQGQVESLAFPVRNHANTAVASVAIEGAAGEQPLFRSPQLDEWRAIVREFESVVQGKPELYANPFEHIDPDRIRFGRNHSSK